MRDSVIDNMKKESKHWKFAMLFFLVLTLLFPLVLMWNDLENYEFILGQSFFVLTCFYFLYGYMYTDRYNICVTREKVIIKTMFRRTEVLTKDIETYSCKRIRRSEMYQFLVSVNGTKVLISTRYRDDVEKLLKENGLNSK